LSDQTSTQIYENVTCPFCGILCDDLRIERTGDKLKVLNKGCGQSAAGFQRELPPVKPMIQGREVSQEEAVTAAAGLVGKAKLPMFGGLSTDVAGMRSVMALADRTGGVVDHALSEAQFRNFNVLQRSGWILSTLTETRNRADLLIIVGTDVHKLHSRFFERIVCPPDSMFEDQASKRTVVFIGEGLDTAGAVGSRIGEVITLPCKQSQLTEVLLALRARLNDMSLTTTEPEAPKRTGILSSILPQLRGNTASEPEVGGIKLSQLDNLAERCKSAKYGVMIWAPPGLNVPQADLTVQAITEIVKDLNVTTRFAGLSLGGNEGAVTAAGVCSWQTGYPSRVSYASGAPIYDLYRNSIGRMLAANEGDLLVWVASITPNLVPPETRLPKIVLGTPGFRGAEQAAVYIPVGTPGIDHAGLLVRCDNVVALPMKNLGRSRLPRVADVLAAIQAAL
jgi:formylmethanofuran dehydrogenase subunit B